MADYPIKELENKTPLMIANTPSMDLIAKNGCTGLFETIPPDMPTGSAVANLSVLGYDPRTTFQGRGVLEAASLGVTLNDNDMAMRINFITIENGKIKSHSSGHISNNEAHDLLRYLEEEKELIQVLRNYFNSMPITLYPGLSYRHLLVVKNGNPDLKCFPPHDNIDKNIEEILIKPISKDAEETAALLNLIISDSYKFLKNHPINVKRKHNGELTANALWPWSPGKKPKMKTYQELYNISGACISAVDLIKGLSKYAGFDIINVKGATGFYDTNYEGKADAVLKALEDHDLVFVHIEACDEASHSKDLKLKIRCLEDLDSRLIRIILDGIKKKNIETTIALLPDHATSIISGMHVRDHVPVAIWDPMKKPDYVTEFNEESVKKGHLGTLKGDQFIKNVIA